ncbi:serine hydrolase domain-containing protein [Alkalicoccobacillus porphyridii]|uniref:Serine hydrolase n=1 Tax=Alkalicoccobacillus porphyridii TaxID=2597270 RepID=A0A554A2C7_9BACI|nr:serine hydrolase [Alkalicoccobacillus porphyridii]TSB47806.1 serine hydrolase [Alkalicoccobacillus porphyridii]
MKKITLLMLAWLILSIHSPKGYAEGIVTPSGIPISDMEETVDQIMNKYIGDDVPGASVSIVQDGEIVLEKGYGLANLEENIQVDAASTYMEAGSVSKLFTWTAIMQLVEEGQISLDTDIREYLGDGQSNLTYDKPITLNHLMTHTAGFEERVEHLTVYDTEHIYELEDYLSPERQPKQIYSPGEIVAYSNFSTNLAGYIVEQLTGMPFKDYIQQSIFEPLEMNDSTFDLRDDLIPGLMEDKAIGYKRAGDEWVANPTAYINDVPAGGLTTTARDMAHFMMAHLNNDGSGPYSLFSDQETLDQMHETLYTSHPELSGNAHGFWERQAGAYRIIEHGGNTDAFSALVSIVPDEQFGIAVMTNMDGEMAGARRELTDVLIGPSEEVPEATTEYNHSEEVEGRYRSARSVETGPMKIMPFLSDADSVISANEDGSIQLSIAALGVDVTYVETSPYLFERVTSENTLLDNAGMHTSKMFFQTNEDGDVVKLSYGVIADELPVPFAESHELIYSLIGFAAVLSIAGIGWSIVRFVINRRRAKKNKPLIKSLLYRGATLWSLVGILTMINTGAIILKYASNPFQAWSDFTIHVIAYWILLIAAIVLLYPVVKGWSAQKGSYMLKAYILLLGCSLVGLFYILYFVNFLTLAG